MRILKRSQMPVTRGRHHSHVTRAERREISSESVNSRPPPLTDIADITLAPVLDHVQGLARDEHVRTIAPAAADVWSSASRCQCLIDHHHVEALASAPDVPGLALRPRETR